MFSYKDKHQDSVLFNVIYKFECEGTLEAHARKLKSEYSTIKVFQINQVCSCHSFFYQNFTTTNNTRATQSQAASVLEYSSQNIHILKTMHIQRHNPFLNIQTQSATLHIV